MGGRSRVAAQMLQARGFRKVINVSGGINAWQEEVAIGPQDLGIDLFDGSELPMDVLKVAYSLEQGLREFYVSMEAQAENEQVKDLFGKLSDIEVKHQMAVYLAYCDISPEEVSKDEFEKQVVIKSMEGGMSTQEYLDLFQPDLSSAFDVVSLAMSIEAQALDLYLRVADKIENPDSRQIIEKIAREEKMHLASLGDLMEKL
jgi:rubrerythrin